MHLQLRYWAFKFDLSLCCTWLVFNQIVVVRPDFWTARPSAVPTLGRHPDTFVAGTSIWSEMMLLPKSRTMSCLEMVFLAGLGLGLLRRLIQKSLLVQNRSSQAAASCVGLAHGAGRTTQGLAVVGEIDHWNSWTHRYWHILYWNIIRKRKKNLIYDLQPIRWSEIIYRWVGICSRFVSTMTLWSPLQLVSLAWQWGSQGWRGLKPIRFNGDIHI